METEMNAIKKEMRFVISTILVNIKTIALLGLLGAFVSLLTLLFPIDNMYKASSSVCSTLFNDNYDNTKSVRLMANFMDLFESSLIQNKIIEVTGLTTQTKDFKRLVNLKNSPSSTILAITARHKNPAIAVEIANATAHIMIIEADRLFETPSGIKVLDKAYIAEYAYKSKTIHMLICFIITFMFFAGACIYYIVKALSSDKVLFIEDCTMDGELEIIGVIPFSK